MLSFKLKKSYKKTLFSLGIAKKILSLRARLKKRTLNLKNI